MGAGLEGWCHKGMDHYRVTEHPDGEGGGNGDGTTGALAGERGRGLTIGDEIDAGHTHPAWCRVQRLGDGGRES